MSPVDYVIDLLLIALVLRQIRRQPPDRWIDHPAGYLDHRRWPDYLRPFQIGGNDLALIVLLTAVGTALGMLSGLATRAWRRQWRDHVSSESRRRAALDCRHGWTLRLRVLQHPRRPQRGRPVLHRAQHHRRRRWMTALVLMAFGEVLARVLVLQIRRVRQSAASD